MQFGKEIISFRVPFKTCDIFSYDDVNDVITQNNVCHTIARMS